MNQTALDNWDFIDALRETIGLRPLYRTKTRPCYERAALEAMGRAIGDGNRRALCTSSESTYRSSQSEIGVEARELSPRQLARLRASKPLKRGARRLNGQRVGLAFVTLGKRSL